MIDFNQKLHNTDKFRQAAIFFQEHGCYTLAPRGTTDYNKYWEQETDRCLNGYTAPDGEGITGYNYFYLNYSPIMRLKEEEYTDREGNLRKRRQRILEFPSFWDYDYYYFCAIEQAELEGKHMAVLKCRQRGYEQPYSELVATPNGFVQMGSLKVGDEIWNPDGKTTKVLEIYEQGFKDVYKLTLADGRSVRCGADHLWEVVCANNHFKHNVLTTHDLLNNGLYNQCTVKGKRYNAYKYYLPAIEPLQYNEKQQNIPAYVLGALLGDGALTKRTPKISSIDQEILDRIQYLLGDGFEFKYDPTTSCEYRIIDKERFMHKDEFENGQYGVNRLHRWIDDLGLCVSCAYKFIPDQYKYGSIEQRYELIRGLMDTDGYISKDGGMSFVNTSKQLIDDFVEVLRSLGILCSVSKRAPGKGGVRNGRAIFGTKFSYVVYIKGNSDIFHLSRKRNRIRKNRKFSNKVAITNIEYLGEQEKQRCIFVSNENHLYLTRDYIPTHNSFKGGSMLVRNYMLIPGSKNFAIASEQKFLIGDGLLTKAWQIMDFLDKHTAWAKQRLVSTRMERTSGYKITDEFGKQTEQGYLSSITGITLKNDPERVRGTRAKLVLWEEGGKFPSLLDAWRIEQPSVETDDGKAFGLMIAFGTGGTEGASFEGLKELFYKPKSYNVLSFPNIWDDGRENTECAFFVPAYSNLESFDDDGNQVYMDKDGNSYKEKAIKNLIDQRNKVKDGGASQQSIDRFISERPIKPAEAVLELGKNIFPRKLLMDQLTRIRTNKKLQSMKHIVDLEWDGNGQVKATEKPSGDITNYPLKKGDKPHGSVVIWEYPVKDPPLGLYIGGCLTPGEKVQTQRGLISVENVTLDDSLVNKDGQFVSIRSLQRYQKENEDIYKVRVSNTYRTTTFTREHPILVSDTLFGDYRFERMKDVKVGQYTRIPNLYKGSNCDICAPNNNLDFWWFVGLWLGDGWCDAKKHSVSIAFDIKQKCFYERYYSFLNNVLHINYYQRQKGNALEVNFTSKEISEWLTNKFGKYAYGKHIPVQIKQISDYKKAALIHGYLDSDGCVYKYKSGKSNMEFVSVNNALLEDIQDLCFALGACGGISKLRNAKKEYIQGRLVNQRECFHLRFGYTESCKLYKWFRRYTDYDDCKLDNIDINLPSQNHQRKDCIIDGDYIYFKIKSIEQSKYTGIVYNFECNTHTFMCRNIMTHNCDPLTYQRGIIEQKR